MFYCPKPFAIIAITSLLTVSCSNPESNKLQRHKKYIASCTEEVRSKMKNPYTFRVRKSAVTIEGVKKKMAALGSYDTLVQLNTTGTNSYGGEIANIYLCGFEDGTLYFVGNGNNAENSFTLNGRVLDFSRK